MTYFNLRKHEAAPEPETAEEELDEQTEDTGGHGSDSAEPPTSWGAAIAFGIRGPSAWLMGRLGASTAWTVHVVAVWACAFYGGWTAFALAVAWLAAVLLFIPREHLEQWAARIEQRGTPREEPLLDVTEDVAEEPPLSPQQALARWLLDTIGKRPGIHLRELYPAMRKLPGREACTDPQLKALLRGFGVPVHRSLRIGRISGRSGVRRSDVEALLPARGESRVDSGLSAGQNEDSPPALRSGEGLESA